MSSRNFNNTAAQEQASTTARELMQELASYTASLKQAYEQLSAEIDNMAKSKDEIQSEYTDAAQTFVKNSLPELNGSDFDKMADLAQKTPQVGQGLVYLRQTLLKSRDAALESVNQARNETLDAAGFQAELDKALQAVEAAGQKKTAADTALRDATTAQRNWKRTPEYKLVQLNNSIQEKGGHKLSQENSDYYDPKNIFTASWRFMTRDDSYRAARKLLVQKGHGEEGKDVLADTGAALKKDQTYAQAVETAAAEAQATGDQYNKANADAAPLVKAQAAIKSDEQILAYVQAKVVSYLSTPEFAKAVADEYGEDFPHSIPMLAAKLTTLAKIQESAEAKKATLHATVESAVTQYRQVSRLRPQTEVKVDLDAVKRQNAARTDAYTDFTRATNQSWTRTTSYTPPSSTVYVNQGPDFFQLMLWEEILNSHHQDYGTPVVVSPLAPYAADILGIDKTNAASSGLDQNIADALNASSSQASSSLDQQIDSALGDISGTPSSLDQQISSALDDVPAGSSGNYERSNSSWSSSSSSSSSPSFGGGGGGT